MEIEPMHRRLAALRESALRRERKIRQRMEWVEACRLELWSRQYCQGAPLTPVIFEEYAARAAEPVRQVQARREVRHYEARPPYVAPRPAEVLLAQFRDILLQASAMIEADFAMDEHPADTQQLVTAEP